MTQQTMAHRGSNDQTRRLIYLGPVLGVVAAATLVVLGVVPSGDDGGGLFGLIPAFIAPFMLALAVGNPPKEHPARHVLLASVPLAFGLVTITVVLGSFLVDSLAWWIGGAIVSAVPFVAAGLAARR
ncbi:MAG: hypothetical protein ACTHXO_07355 [Actinomycetaceae bacterium]